jgi:2-hydroxychromene-2-carboxylate isomerase
VADVDFFFDPICPWAWITSRWVVEVADQRGLEVDWRFIALRILNEARVDQMDERHREAHLFGFRLLRVAAAVKDEVGPGPIGDYYTAVGRGIHIEGAREQLATKEGIAGVLGTLGLSTALADAAEDERWDTVLRADTEEGLRRVGNDVGTPIITFASPDGPSFFGPVISRVPRGQEALDLWDAVVAVAKVPGFAELKRSLRERAQVDS